MRSSRPLTTSSRVEFGRIKKNSVLDNVSISHKHQIWFSHLRRRAWHLRDSPIWINLKRLLQDLNRSYSTLDRTAAVSPSPGRLECLIWKREKTESINNKFEIDTHNSWKIRVVNLELGNNTKNHILVKTQPFSQNNRRAPSSSRSAHS